MPKYKIHIPANTAAEIKAALSDAAYILTALNEAVHKYDSNMNGPNAQAKIYWKQKAQAWVDKHKVMIDEN
jgi:hypothetical protein